MSCVITETWKCRVQDRVQSDEIVLEASVVLTGGALESWSLTLSSGRFPERSTHRPALLPEDSVYLDQTFPHRLSIRGKLCCQQLRSGICLIETEQLTYGFPERLHTTLGAILLMDPSRSCTSTAPPWPDCGPVDKDGSTWPAPGPALVSPVPPLSQGRVPILPPSLRREPELDITAGDHLRSEIDLLCKPSRPMPPAALRIESFNDISAEAFPLLAARYPDERLELPPEPKRTVTGLLRSGEPLSLSLPEGYEATLARIGYVLPPGQRSMRLRGVVARTAVAVEATSTGVASFDMHRDRGVVQVVIQASDPLAPPPSELLPAQLTVEIEAVPSERALNEWRLRTFRTIHRSMKKSDRTMKGRIHGNAG